MRYRQLLMHVCCGPCAVWPVHFLTESGGFNITGLFYNPNIHPVDEFEQRKATALEYFYYAGLPISSTDDFRQSQWEEYENNQTLGGKAARCEMCYRSRLEYTASVAAEEGYDAFTTSLLVSPYQDHDLIREICKDLSHQLQVDFYYHDFRPHFRDGQKMAKELNLYRQKYCGCILSREGK